MAIFVLLQFGRIMAYVECRLLLAAGKAAPCDCEQVIVGTATPEDEHSPLHHSFSKTITEELFDDINSLILPALTAYEGIVYPLYKSPLATTPSGDLFRPPRV